MRVGHSGTVRHLPTLGTKFGGRGDRSIPPEAENRGTLTDVPIKKAGPADKPYKMPDSGGLYGLASTTGNRSWRLKYRLGKKEKLLTFGSYPDVSLIRARCARRRRPRCATDEIPPWRRSRPRRRGPSQRRTSSRHAPGNGARSTNRAGARRMSPHSGRFAPTLAWRRFPPRRTLHFLRPGGRADRPTRRFGFTQRRISVREKGACVRGCGGEPIADTCRRQSVRRIGKSHAKLMPRRSGPEPSPTR